MLMRLVIAIALSYAGLMQSAMADDAHGGPSLPIPFKCADNVKVQRLQGTAEYLGADSKGMCVVRYNYPGRSPDTWVQHLDLVFVFEDYDPLRNHDAVASILGSDSPGQRRDVYQPRGGGLWTYEIIDRHDFRLNGRAYPCVHYTVRFRHGGGSGYTDMTNDFWTDPTDGVLLSARGPWLYVHVLSITEEELTH
jgi:hypothetical protein